MPSGTQENRAGDRLVELHANVGEDAAYASWFGWIRRVMAGLRRSGNRRRGQDLHADWPGQVHPFACLPDRNGRLLERRRLPRQITRPKVTRIPIEGDGRCRQPHVGRAAPRFGSQRRWYRAPLDTFEAQLSCATEIELHDRRVLVFLATALLPSIDRREYGTTGIDVHDPREDNGDAEDCSGRPRMRDERQRHYCHMWPLRRSSARDVA
jgi:hypothetical protein